jgi:hypothetical protein
VENAISWEQGANGLHQIRKNLCKFQEKWFNRGAKPNELRVWLKLLFENDPKVAEVSIAGPQIN